MKKDARWGVPFFDLAAAAVVIAAAGVAAAQRIAATAVAQQEDQNDDPANITAAETVIVTHNEIPPGIFQRLKPLIPRYSPAAKRCSRNAE